MTGMTVTCPLEVVVSETNAGGLEIPEPGSSVLVRLPDNCVPELELRRGPEVLLLSVPGSPVDEDPVVVSFDAELAVVVEDDLTLPGAESLVDVVCNVVLLEDSELPVVLICGDHGVGKRAILQSLAGQPLSSTVKGLLV